jgi:D-alanine-D-alanine ligase
MEPLLAVVYGGDSRERAGSIASARAVMRSLRRQRVPFVTVDPSRGNLLAAFAGVSHALVTMHGAPGEDGSVQGFLETLGIEYTGSDVRASALAIDKHLTKGLLRAHGLRVTDDLLLNGRAPNAIRELEAKLRYPIFVKPVEGGGSLGAGIARDRAELRRLLDRAADDDLLLAEPYLQGLDLTCGLLQRSSKLDALPLLSTVTDREFYDYEAKHNDSLRQHQCPAPLARDVAAQVVEQACQAFDLLGCRGFARVDFMITSAGPLLLEVNTIPGLSEEGNMATMAAAAGMSYDELIRDLLSTIELDVAALREDNAVLTAA